MLRWFFIRRSLYCNQLDKAEKCRSTIFSRSKRSLNVQNLVIFEGEQVINNAICNLFLHYLRDPEFQFHSYGHIVSLLSRITLKERRFAFRISGRVKRLPRDDDGNRWPVQSLQSLECDCESNLVDPARVCEMNEQIENLL